MNLTFLKKKKIAILGFGTEGCALFNFLERHGLSASILDRNEKLELSDNQKPGSFLGKDYLDHLDKFDLIFRSPGINPLHPNLLKAKKRRAEISSPTGLFLMLCPCPVVGITGTKGKGTTSKLLYELLLAEDFDAYLAGNIGNSPLDFLNKLSENSIVVLELSSFQLQDLQTSPHFAVLLGISSDHLDYHKNVDEYHQSKLSIVKYQNQNDMVIINADSPVAKSFAQKTPAKKYWFSIQMETEPGAYLAEDKLYLKLAEEPFLMCEARELRLKGEHNVQNVLASSLAAAVIGVKNSTIQKVIRNYAGLPHHRQEYIDTIDKVDFINDSAATIPEAAIAAIKTYAQPKIMLLGGSEKGSQYQQLAEEILKNRVKAVILTGATGEKIQKSLQDLKYNGKIIVAKGIIKEMVAEAKRISSPGDVVILSPASASFGLFKNYQDRGEQFVQAVKNLQNPRV